MDTTTEALSRAHENLAADLAKVSQLITPENQQALAMLYRVQRRLEDIKELAAQPATDHDDEDEGSETLGPRSFLWHENSGDTLNYCSSVLQGLTLMTDGAEVTSQKQRFGIYIILEMVCQALDYETHRVTRRETSGDAS